uniref:Ig-like domain-containing protein n=1 Tax=Oryctolagus cuniculus TaxID=9986 RepID=A0A5F9C6R3_RABIT
VPPILGTEGLGTWSWDPASGCLPGTLPRPSLRAEPGSVITLGRPGALWCQGTLEAQECRLYRERIPEPWDRQMPLEPRNKVKFSIPLMAEVYARRYRCVCLSAAGWSEPSDTLELGCQVRVTQGAYSKPSLSALPSPVVTSGGNVTLQCRSQLGFHRFILTEEGAPWAARTQSSEPRPSAQSQALFPVGPVTPSRRWAFQCYGSYRENPSVWSEPSDALELGEAAPGGCNFDSFPGTLPKPSIWADPGPLVAVGSPVTLWCQGSLQAEVYHMYTESGRHPWETRPQQDSRHKASFSVIKSMSSHDTGQYCCVYWTSLGHSQPSDPLTLVVTGMFPAPSLSAQPSPVVASGENVSLSCGSDEAGTAHLLKEGGAGPLHSLEARYSHGAGLWQATFLLGPVDSTQRGIYRCYRGDTNKTRVWSLPSDPLQLEVSGEGPSPVSSVLMVSAGLSPQEDWAGGGDLGEVTGKDSAGSERTRPGGGAGGSVSTVGNSLPAFGCGNCLGAAGALPLFSHGLLLP